jgi:hypothetical protein
MTDLVTATPRGLLRPLVGPGEIIAAQEEVSQLIVKALVDGTDYGEIPGSKKKTLLKPGAERLLKAFGCHASYDIVDREIEHDRKVEFQKRSWNHRSRGYETTSGTAFGLYRYVTRCTLRTYDGADVGSGIGSCSTMESKYVDRPRDLENTVLKMAQKRALVAAALNTFGLSDRFTQDLEDVEAADVETRAVTPGFDPDDPQKVSFLEKELTKRKVPQENWPTIKEKMKGKTISHLQELL